MNGGEVEGRVMDKGTGLVVQRFDETICKVVEREADAIWGASSTARRGASTEIT